jgi:hypothetical protein
MAEPATETDSVKAPNSKREPQRRWYRSLSPDQLTARRVRQAEQKRIRREKEKAGICTPRKRMSADERRERLRIYNREWQRQRRAKLKATKSPLQPVSESTAPMTPSKPKERVRRKPAKSTKPKSERARHREYRATLAEYLEDCLTDPAAPMSGAEFERMRLASAWMGWFDRLDKLEVCADGKAEMLAEMRVSIALECLRRLAEMKPASSSPALTGSRYTSFESQGIRPKYPGE